MATAMIATRATAMITSMSVNPFLSALNRLGFPPVELRIHPALTSGWEAGRGAAGGPNAKHIPEPEVMRKAGESEGSKRSSRDENAHARIESERCPVGSGTGARSSFDGSASPMRSYHNPAVAACFWNSRGLDLAFRERENPPRAGWISMPRLRGSCRRVQDHTRNTDKDGWNELEGPLHS